MKLKGIDGGPHKQRSMWFNSTQREEPYHPSANTAGGSDYETVAVHTHGGLHRRLDAAPGAELTQTTLRVSEADTTKIAEIPENAGKNAGITAL